MQILEWKLILQEVASSPQKEQSPEKTSFAESLEEYADAFA